MSAESGRTRTIRLAWEGEEGSTASELAAALSAEEESDTAGPSDAVIAVSCSMVRDASLVIDEVTGYRHDEGYRIRFDGRAAGLEATSRRGVRNGVATLVQLSHGWPSGAFEIEDTPSFPVRGVIEGYYGPPWNDGQRRRVMRRAAAWKMNAYMYAPKDDLYHRSRWRDPYPPAEGAALARLVADASSLELDFWYAIGPGLSMEYSSDDDFVALARKLDGIAGLGVRHFGLLFDDIPPRLQHSRDRDAFASLAEAHARVANRLLRSLSDSNERPHLVVCPTHYHGDATAAYVQELGLLLDPRIDFFWTGPEICSRELTLRDAATVERVINRPVIYWDNYPVNDLEMRNELHLGPYRGRDPHLFRAARGVLANATEYPEASQVPLLTIADYLWNPVAYDAEASWRHALEVVVGRDDAEGFAAFADCNRFSALFPTDAPLLAEELERTMFRLELGDADGAAALLGTTVDRLERANEVFARGMKNHGLEREVTEWREKYRLGVELVRHAVPLVAAAAEGAPGRDSAARRAFIDVAREYRAHPRYTFADVLNGLIERFGGEL